MKYVVPATIFFGGGFVFTMYFQYYQSFFLEPVSDDKPSAIHSKGAPNVIIFFADDIGWGDYGANWKAYENVTVNLNKMAKRGMRLTDFHTGSSVCGPSRAALLTGRLGLRTGLVRNFVPGSVGGLPTNETTLAEALKSGGYNTGMIGKWHLGITEKYHPNSRGFDFYYGLPYSNDMGCVDVPTFNYPPGHTCPQSTNKKNVQYGGNYHLTAVPLYDDREIVEQPVDLINLGDHYAYKAEEFLTHASKQDKPFFLYVAFAHMHVPHAHAPRFTNSTDVNTVYADTLHEMDDVIGRVLGTVETLGLDERTMVWFTGDNGPWVAKCQYAGNQGPFLGSWLKNTYGGGSTAKCTTWEAGHREPAVVMWPGTIKPNTVSNALMSTMDIFPTVLHYAGLKMPKNRKFDGINQAAVLEGTSIKGHDVLYHPNSGVTFPYGEIDTLRLGPYKVFWKTGGAVGMGQDCAGVSAPEVSHDPPLIFNLEKDPQESVPITADTDPEYEEVVTLATQLRKDLLADIKADNTSVPDYSQAEWAYPCCDSTQFLCRCKKDNWINGFEATKL